MLKGLKRLLASRMKQTGEAGERVAEQFLRREKRFKVVSRNWRHGRDEIDLIAYDADILVFVEVKTRRAGGLVPGYYAVDNRKKRALRRAANAYIQTLKKPPLTYRLDVVEVNYKPDLEWDVLHFYNIDW